MVELDYYELLGVQPAASLTEIKRAYRKLARKYHPDSGHPESSRDLFEQITRAYDTLSTPDRRLSYDTRHGYHHRESPPENAARSTDNASSEQAHEAYRRQDSTTGERSASGNRSSGSSHAAQFQHPPTKSSSAASEPSDSSVIQKLGKMIKPLIPTSQNIKKSGESKRRLRTKAERVTDQLRGSREYSFTIDALESIHGTTREIAFEGAETPRVIRIKIPPAVTDGSTLKIDVPGEGLVRVHVRIRPHPLVERDGFDLIIKLPITIAEAINGAEADVPTLNGPVRVKLPPKTGDSKRLRLKGRGLPMANLNEHGDLYVETLISPPDIISTSAQDAAAALEAHYREPVRKNVPKKL